MRVLQIHNAYRHYGGEDVVVEEEARLLRQAGHSVRQHTVRNPRGDVEATQKLVRAPWSPASRSALSEIVEETGPDVAHVHNTWFTLTPSIFAALSDQAVPTVMSLHNYRLMCLNGLLLRNGEPCTLCVGKGPGPGVRYRCYRDSFAASAMAGLTLSLNRVRDTWASVDVYLANSDFARNTHITSGLAPEKVQVKPNFASDPGTRPIPPHESNVVLYVGRLSPEKGAHFACDLWEESGPSDLVLRVIGEGPDRERLESSHPNVEFVGHMPRSEVTEEMLRARALLFPSLTYESCPLVLVEAFAAGLPFLTNRRGAMAELAGLMDPEWARQPNDADDWARGLELIRDDRLVSSAGRAARSAYEAYLTPARSLSRMEEIYARAIN